MTGSTTWRIQSAQRTRFTAEGPDSSRRRANDLPSAVREEARASNEPTAPRNGDDSFLRCPRARRLRGRSRAARSLRDLAGGARRPRLPGARRGSRHLRWGLEERREIDALEFIRGRDRAVGGVRGPTLTEVAGEPLEGQIFNVFTLRDGRIIRIDDYRRGRRRSPPRASPRMSAGADAHRTSAGGQSNS